MFLGHLMRPPPRATHSHIQSQGARGALQGGRDAGWQGAPQLTENSQPIRPRRQQELLDTRQALWSLTLTSKVPSLLDFPQAETKGGLGHKGGSGRPHFPPPTPALTQAPSPGALADKGRSRAPRPPQCHCPATLGTHHTSLPQEVLTAELGASIQPRQRRAPAKGLTWQLAKVPTVPPLKFLLN